MSTITTPAIVGMMSNGLLIVSSMHGIYVVHPNWLVVYGEAAR